MSDSLAIFGRLARAGTSKRRCMTLPIRIVSAPASVKRSPAKSTCVAVSPEPMAK